MGLLAGTSYGIPVAPFLHADRQPLGRFPSADNGLRVLANNLTIFRHFYLPQGGQLQHRKSGV